MGLIRVNEALLQELGDISMLDLSSAPFAMPEDLVLGYLDYDGVLHHHEVYWKKNVGAYLKAPPEYRLFQHAALLEQLLEPFPQVRLVLSTSWAFRYHYWKVRKRLPPGLQARCVGATFNYSIKGDAWHSLPRGVQVTRDAEKRQPKGWFALDDDAEGWPEETRGNLIQTDQCEGISPPDIQQAISEKLKQLTAPCVRAKPG